MKEKELQTIEKNQKKKKVNKLTIILLVMLVALIPLYIILPRVIKPYSPPEFYSEKTQLYGTEWTLVYQKGNNSLQHITSEYTFSERYSDYYKQLSNRYGSSDVFVIHKISRTGYPIDDSWYQIIETEKIINGFDQYETISERTIRYEEKLVFNLS